MSLAGIRTRSGTLLPVPGKICLFQGGEIIPQEILQKCYTWSKIFNRMNMKPIIKQLFFIFMLNLIIAFLVKEITNHFEIRNNKTALDHAIWIFTDIRKRGEGHGIFVALALLAGIPTAIIYALVRIGDKKP